MTDRAIPIALIATELITNGIKHAYDGRSVGTIWVRLARGAEDTVELVVRDEGAGLPPKFEPRSATGLGMRIVQAFTQQLKATMTVRRVNPGTELIVSIPIDVASINSAVKQ
jgi:two-component sensor histidine kinase